MSYEEYCDWYAVHGDPQRDAMEYEIAARHDSVHEQGYDRDVAGEMETWEDVCRSEGVVPEPYDPTWKPPAEYIDW